MSLDEFIRHKEAKIAELSAENERLRIERDKLKRMIFGQKRERFVAEDPNQLALALGLENLPESPESSPETETVSYERKKRTGKRPSGGRHAWPDWLPRVEVVYEPEHDLTGYKKIGEDWTEELDYIPAKFFVRRFIRPRYVRLKQDDGQDNTKQEEQSQESNHQATEEQIIDEQVVHQQENQQQNTTESLPSISQAPMPERPLPGISVGMGLLSHIICQKYLEHLPLYRQGQRYERKGVKIPSSTLSNWVMQAGKLIEPLYDCLKAHLLSRDYIQADETPIKVLQAGKGSPLKKKKNNPNRTAKAHRGYYWVYFDPVDRVALFEYEHGRGKQYPAQMLKDFQGVLQTDGYSSYSEIGKRKDITPTFCLAHARRKFFDARANHPKKAKIVLDYIQQLYAVEREARDNHYSHQQRLELRQQKAVTIWKQLENWMNQLVIDNGYTPASAFGKAMNYTMPRIKALQYYLTDGKIEIDNNLIENSIRPVALGRKNYLFAGSEKAARYAGMFYSILASCKAHQIDPEKYLLDIFHRIPHQKASQIQQLLPQNWQPKSPEDQRLCAKV